MNTNDDAMRFVRAKVSGRYPDDENLANLANLAQPIAWNESMPPDERVKAESDLQALADEVRRAFADGGVEGVRVERGQVVWVWTAKSVEALEAEALAHRDLAAARLYRAWLDREPDDDDAGAREAIWAAMELSENE